MLVLVVMGYLLKFAPMGDVPAGGEFPSYGYVWLYRVRESGRTRLPLAAFMDRTRSAP